MFEFFNGKFDGLFGISGHTFPLPATTFQSHYILNPKIRAIFDILQICLCTAFQRHHCGNPYMFVIGEILMSYNLGPNQVTVSCTLMVPQICSEDNILKVKGHIKAIQTYTVLILGISKSGGDPPPPHKLGVG